MTLSSRTRTGRRWLRRTTPRSLVSGRGAGTYCYRVNTNYTIGTETFDSPFSNIVTTTVAEGVTPFFSGAVSRKTHGADAV